MSVRSKLNYLLDKHKITKYEYLELNKMLDGHDRNLRNQTIGEMKTRLDFEFGDAIGVPPAMKKFTKEVVKAVAEKMKAKGAGEE